MCSLFQKQLSAFSNQPSAFVSQLNPAKVKPAGSEYATDN
jgi:hypothetical protein